MKLMREKIKMSILEMFAFGIIIFLTIWLLKNLPDLFRSLKN